MLSNTSHLVFPSESAVCAHLLLVPLYYLNLNGKPQPFLLLSCFPFFFTALSPTPVLFAFALRDFEDSAPPTSNLLIVTSRGVDGMPETDASTIPAAKAGELCTEELDDNIDESESVPVDVSFSSYCAGGDGAPDWPHILLPSPSVSLSTNSGLVMECERLPIVPVVKYTVSEEKQEIIISKSENGEILLSPENDVMSFRNDNCHYFCILL